MEIRDVLVALDLGPGSAATLTEARSVARAFAARLHVLHVVPLKPVPEFGDDETGRQASAARLRGFLDGSPCEPLLRVGEPGVELLAAVRELGADLLVLGVGVRGTLSLLLGGSRVERMIRECPVPTWLVHPERPSPGRVRRVLCGVDPTRGGDEALDAGASVARRFGAELGLVRVVGEVAGEGAAARELRALAAEHPSAAGLAAECLLAGGGRGPGLVGVAEAQAADLLVLGSAGRRGLERWWRGNLAEEVVRRVTCSLLVVPVATGAGAGRPAGERFALPD